MPRPVVVVGDVGLDVLVRPLGPLVIAGDVPSAVRVVPGGAGGNTAAWLATTGVPVALVARVGDDDAGVTARRRLEAEGVRCRFAVDDALPTCTVVCLLDEAGERSMLSDRGAARALAVPDVELGPVGDLFESAAGTPHLHLSGFVLLHGDSRAAGRAALSAAQALGWTTSVDPSAANLVAAVGGSRFLSWLAGVDLLMASADEVRALGGLGRVLETIPEVVVTDGAAGAHWVTRAEQSHVPAPAVDVVDTTGCGDAFTAGLLACWLSGGGRAESLRAGVAAGSAAAASPGARPIARQRT